MKNRKQRTKFNSTYSSWEKILFGVPKGSVLGPCFLIFFFSMNKAGLAIYADDNAPYVTGETIEDVINSVEHNSIKLSKRFSYNQIKANKDKCHLLISENENITINVDDNVIYKSNCKNSLV